MAKDGTLKELLQELADQRNFDFRGHKKTTLERRLRRRMFELNLGDYAEYGEYIRRHPDEVNELLNTLLINVTEFFRDPPAWEILRHEILPPVLKRLKPGHSFRAWSAGCASGEEPYSIAIVLAEHFGPRIQEYDIKIYATDIDEEALNSARRGEYSQDAVRRVAPEWREKYFQGKGLLRVNREIRRLVIFGRCNLIQDAPISHVNLLVCRNILIYFDSELQVERTEVSESRGVQTSRPGQELDGVRQQYGYLLETLRIGIFVLGPDENIMQHNTAGVTLCGLPPANLVGKRLPDTDVFLRLPDLEPQLQAARLNNESTRFQARVKFGPEERLIEVSIRPLTDDNGQRNGTIIYLEDQTVQEKLQTTVEELESTSEELQSANEELETTNEELQSTNEELETTNEELQSTNEELETTNEELQSLNEELETTNQELEERTKELDLANSVYAQTLEKIRLPVMLVNPERRIEFWNAMALRPVRIQGETAGEFDHRSASAFRRAQKHAHPSTSCRADERATDHRPGTVSRRQARHDGGCSLQPDSQRRSH